MLSPAPPPASLPISPHLSSSIVLTALLSRACFPPPTAPGRWKQVPQPGLCSCLWWGQLDSKDMCSPASSAHSSACCHQSQRWSHLCANLERRCLGSRCTPHLHVSAGHRPLGNTLQPKAKEAQLGPPREGVSYRPWLSWLVEHDREPENRGQTCALQTAAKAHNVSSPIPRVWEPPCFLPAVQPGKRSRSRFLSCTAQHPLGPAEQPVEVAEHTLKSRADSPVNPPPRQCCKTTASSEG